MAEFKVNHLHFKTTDPKKTAQWWVDNLGATIVAETGTGGFRMDLYGVPLNVTGLSPGSELDQSYGLEHVGMETDDIAGAKEQFVAAGSRILEERELPDGRRLFYVEGPESSRIEVVEPAK